MPGKNEVARLLALAHHRFEPSIERVVRLISDREQDESEPVKLLEVTSATTASGIVPIAFGADPPEVQFPSVVVEVTPAEYEQIVAGELDLPRGWRLDAQLFPNGA